VFVGYSGLRSGILSGTFPISPVINAVKLIESLEDQFICVFLESVEANNSGHIVSRWSAVGSTCAISAIREISPLDKGRFAFPFSL
jgi:hypothetical protein